ncbi:MAG: TraR/DksA C4-type zinc finger protein [Puniceicoccales bacterium]|jgi:RNA polymerase-binding transcription factor DksA|nr:TraR/DksA C4-type zinc finger protein [Puniceicoccales bacterium]
MDRIIQNRNLSFERVKNQSSMAFTLEDVRRVIRQKSEQAKQVASDEIVKPKPSPVVSIENKQAPQKVGAASIADILGFNPNISKQTETRDKDPFEVPAKYRKYYKLLLKLKFDLKRGLSRLTKEHLSYGTIPTDDSDIESFDSGFALSLLSSEQEALAEIEKAIERIHNGTYGICESTGLPIEAKRLEAVPFTRFSVNGQEEQERLRVAKERVAEPLFETEVSDDAGEFSGYEEE